MVNKEYTALLAKSIENLKEQTLTDELIHQVKLVVMDYLCAAIAGSRTNVSQSLYGYLLKEHGEGKSNVIGYEKGLSRESAALMNGTSAHCLELDDGHTDGSVHPGAVVISALLAVAEHEDASPMDFIKSIIAGYEVCLRISSAIHPASRQRGFHNTPVAGIFGASAALSYLRGLGQKEIQQALGNAASFSGGLFAFLGTGSDIKRIHPGQAARDAILANELVAIGIPGPESVLENQNGFFQAFAGGEISEEKMLRDLGDKYEIMNVYFKPYSCCRHLHSSIDAIYTIKEQQPIPVDQISKIRAGVYKVASYHDHTSCLTLLDAQMSLPFAIAASIVHESLQVDTFQPENAEQSMQELMNLVEVYVDDEVESLYPKRRAAKIEIELNNSERMTCFVDNPLGEPDNPLSFEQMKLKFLNNCSPILGERQAQDIINKIDHLEESIQFLYQI